MDKSIIDEAIKIFEEESCIEAYESLIEVVFGRHRPTLDENKFHIPKYRMDVLQKLIEAKYLDFQQLLRIYKVDNVLISNDFPPQLEYFQTWLEKHGLIDPDPDKLDDFIAQRVKLKYIDYEPKHQWYSKQSIEFFKRRNEVYLNIWEKATIDDIKVFNSQIPRSIASMRSALQRVFWGNHLNEGELIRLLHADLKLYRDPQADQIASQYLSMFWEVFKQFDIYDYFSESDDPSEDAPEPTESIIKSYLNEWDWFTHDWEDYHLNDDQIETSILSRIFLDVYYRKDALTERAISELIELDLNALLSPNWMFLSGDDRIFVSKFLIEQGVFDPQDPGTAYIGDDNYIYLKK